MGQPVVIDRRLLKSKRQLVKDCEMLAKMYLNAVANLKRVHELAKDDEPKKGIIQLISAKDYSGRLDVIQRITKPFAEMKYGNDISGSGEAKESEKDGSADAGK